MVPGTHAKERGDHPAVIMAASGKVTTYRELDERSNQLAQHLHDLGLGRGDVIAILLENHPRFPEVCWAAERSGPYDTAISTRLITDEIAYIVEDSGAGVVITSRAQSDVAVGLRDRGPGLDARLMLDGADDGYQDYGPTVADRPIEPLPEQPKGQDLLYSSGTTGRPKGIKPPLTDDPVDAVAGLGRLGQLLYGMDADTVYLSTAPLYHTAPLRFCMGIHRLGATVIVTEHVDPEDTLRLIEEHCVTHGQFVPTMFVRLLRLPAEVRERYDVSSLQAAIHAAAPCPVPVKEQMVDWWGPVIHEYYAGTEGNGFVAIDSHRWLEHKGSVGRLPCRAAAHPHGQAVQVRVAGPVLGDHLRPGAPAPPRSRRGRSARPGQSPIVALGWASRTRSGMTSPSSAGSHRACLLAVGPRCQPSPTLTVPPATMKTRPVTSRESGLASHTATGAMLAGSPGLNSSSAGWGRSGLSPSVSRVSAPGEIALTVTP